MRQLRRTLAVTLLTCGAAPCLGVDLPSLAATRLFSKIARNCVEVDLKTWRHPARSVLLASRVAIEKVRLCNGGVYPVFFVRFPYDPQGETASYFQPLYDRMRSANGGHAFAFVAVSDNTVVMARYRRNAPAELEYEMYRP